MEMTFNQYIQNPLGKENAVFSNRNMYKELYINKLDKLLVREAGKTTYKIYMDKGSNKYYVYFKIPSETLKDFYYDIVIEFYSENKASLLSRSLTDYKVKFYSNDPSFVFTFAFAFNKQNLIVDDLKSKLPSKCLKERAVEKNPKSLVGYVKTIYFAYLLMNRYNLFNKITYEVTGFKYMKSGLLDQIMDAQKKIDLRIEGEEELKKKERIEKAKRHPSRTTGMMNHSNNKEPSSSYIKDTPITKVAKAVGISKSMKATTRTHTVRSTRRTRKTF